MRSSSRSGKDAFSHTAVPTPFAWSSVEVFQLMEDLKSHFDKHPDDEKKYYLGMLTVVNQKIGLILLMVNSE